MPEPKLAVSLLEPEEADTYQSIRHTTFTDTVNKILYTNSPSFSPSPATHATVISSIQAGITEKEQLYLKCVDTGTEEMIAGARWRWLGPTQEEWAKGVRERREVDVEKDLVVPERYPESDEKVWDRFFTGFAEHKRMHMARRPYYVLDTLVTHPSHHRRGAGSLLIQWGCERADEKGVESYVEASPMGAPLYERWGFREVGRLVLGLNEEGEGGREIFEFIMMIRPAKGERE